MNRQTNGLACHQQVLIMHRKHCRQECFDMGGKRASTAWYHEVHMCASFQRWEGLGALGHDRIEYTLPTGSWGRHAIFSA